MNTRQPRHLRLLALTLAVAATLAGCGETEPDGSIQFDLQPIPGQPWTATGGLVDAGLVCEEGTRRLIGFAFPDGTPITFEEFLELPDDADFLGKQNYTCADGSGTFTIVQPMNGGAQWSVIDGTGMFTEMTGEGTETFDPSPPPGTAVVNGVFEMGDRDR